MSGRRKTAQRDIRPFNFLLNQKGMDEDDGVFTTDPASADLIRNMHPDKKGEYTTVNQGFSKLNTTAYSAHTIDSLYLFKEEDGTPHFLTAINGSVLDVSPSTGVSASTVHSANTAGNRVRCTTSYGAAYMVEKTMEPQNFDGTTNNVSSGFPATSGTNTFSKPSLICNYTDHVVYANFNGTAKFPSHIVVSDLGQPDSFTFGSGDADAHSQSVNAGDGQEITGLHTMFIPSQNQEYLIVFKDKSIYGLSGDTPNTYRVFQINSTFGAVGQEAITQVGTDIIFIGDKNIYSLKTSLDSGSLRPEAIGSRRVRETLQEMNMTYKQNCVSIALPDRQEVWFGIPTGSSAVPNKTLVYNYRHTDPRDGVWIIRDGFTMPSAAAHETVLYTGSEDGYIRKWFSSSDYDGASFQWEYRYPFFSFGTENQHKRTSDAKSVFRLLSDTVINIKTRWRAGGNDTSNTISQTLEVDDNTAIYNISRYGIGVYSESSDRLYQLRFPVYGDGIQLQLSFYGNTLSGAPTFVGTTGFIEFGGFERRYN